MTTNDQSPSGNVIRTRWLNPRRKRFWAIILFLAYSLFGFFAVPPLLRDATTGLLQDELGRDTSIGKIRFNPYALSLHVQEFEMQDTDGVRLVGFQEFYVNFQWASLLKWAWTFSNVQLRDPYFHFERFDDGATRISRLLGDFAALSPEDSISGQQPDDEVPRLLLRNLLIENGTIDTTDRVPVNPVQIRLAPINIAMQELSTIPDQHGQKTITIHLPDGASIEWSGRISLAPLSASGQLVLASLQLNPFTAYLEHMLPLESVSARLSSRFAYSLWPAEDGSFNVDLDDLDVVLSDIHVTGLQPVARFIDIGELALREGKFRLAERSLHFGRLDVEEPRVMTWLDENGQLSLAQLVPANSNDAPENTASGEPALPWRLGIGEFLMDGGRVSFDDRSIIPNAMIALTGLQTRISNINNEPGASMQVEISGGLDAGGRFSFTGSFGVMPAFTLSGDAGIQDIPLSVVQPYAQQFALITIEDGRLDSTLEVQLPAGQALTVAGALQVPGLDVNDSANNEKLLGWTLLDIDRFNFDGDALHISSLALEQPYGRFVIFDDLSTNVAGLARQNAEQPAEEAGQEAIDIVIGQIDVNQGAMDFADYSLPLPFATHITSLGGRISTIAASSAEPASIRLEGQVEEFGLARIDGSMNVLDPVDHTDVSVEFRNLLMSSLSPYTVAFAGRKIDQGKLDLDLAYRIDGGTLHGYNEVVLSDLVLGEKVDHPDAASLPLGLAVSLLKDADGVIRIDLPVEGDVNDPEFRIGSVIWKAFTGMITKLVAAPFRLLGNLIGVDSEDFGQFQFLAGRSDLTPPELEMVAQLEQALLQRPELAVEINGVMDPAIDTPAIQDTRLREAVNLRLAGRLEDAARDDAMMLDEEVRGMIETLFAERFPDTPPASLRALHTAPPADDPASSPVLDKLAYTADLWNRLLETEEVGEQDLAVLATERATAIREAFLASGKVSESRITLGETTQVESEDGEWVVLELAVTSG